MKEKGFTLIELIGVIVLLAIIILITYPSIVNIIKKSNNKIDSATSALIISGAKNMVDENKNSYPLTNGNVYCVTIKSLINKGYVISDLETGNGNKINTDRYVMIKVNSNKYKYTILAETEKCDEKRDPVIVDPDVPASTPYVSITKDGGVSSIVTKGEMEYVVTYEQSITDSIAQDKIVAQVLVSSSEFEVNSNTTDAPLTITIQSENVSTINSKYFERVVKLSYNENTGHGSYAVGTKFFLRVKSGLIKNTDGVESKELNSSITRVGKFESNAYLLCNNNCATINTKCSNEILYSDTGVTCQYDTTKTGDSKIMTGKFHVLEDDGTNLSLLYDDVITDFVDWEPSSSYSRTFTKQYASLESSMKGYSDEYLKVLTSYSYCQGYINPGGSSIGCSNNDWQILNNIKARIPTTEEIGIISGYYKPLTAGNVYPNFYPVYTGNDLPEWLRATKGNPYWLTGLLTSNAGDNTCGADTGSVNCDNSFSYVANKEDLGKYIEEYKIRPVIVINKSNVDYKDI